MGCRSFSILQARRKMNDSQDLRLLNHVPEHDSTRTLKTFDCRGETKARS